MRNYHSLAVANRSRNRNTNTSVEGTSRSTPLCAQSVEAICTHSVATSSLAEDGTTSPCAIRSTRLDALPATHRYSYTVSSLDSHSQYSSHSRGLVSLDDRLRPNLSLFPPFFSPSLPLVFRRLSALDADLGPTICNPRRIKNGFESEHLR